MTVAATEEIRSAPPDGPRAVALPPLRADLLLLHPPAFFDFRERRDVYFPFLSTSGDVPITPLYEYFPVGWKSLQRFLGSRGHRVLVLNLASLLLLYPAISVDDVVAALDVAVVGIDLHWMVHAQGALAIAERIKAQRSDLAVLLGGLSATYFAGELIRRPSVDLLMRGYDTLEPMDRLLSTLRAGGDLRSVPNLLFKGADGQIIDNGLTHVPSAYGCGIDWSQPPPAPAARRGMPIREFLLTDVAGCRHDCPWCGSSRAAFRRIHRCSHPIAHKPAAELAYERSSIRRMPDGGSYHLYVAGAYHHDEPGLLRMLDELDRTGCRSVSLEQFFLPSDAVLARIGRMAAQVHVTLSPQSHDRRVARLAGRGVFDEVELEAWLERALDRGVHAVDLWYFVGMPEQTEELVADNVRYCAGLLQRFSGRNVHPLICPMVPFIDPGSNIFERPERYGYRLFCRTAADHVRALERPSFVRRLNYETRWLRRSEIVSAGFRAVRDLMQAKADVGMLPRSTVRRYTGQIDDALSFSAVVDEIDQLGDEGERRRELDAIGDEILERNRQVFSSLVHNQAFPLRRPVGGRWFDELGWPPELLEAAARRAGAGEGGS